MARHRGRRWTPAISTGLTLAWLTVTSVGVWAQDPAPAPGPAPGPSAPAVAAPPKAVPLKPVTGETLTKPAGIALKPGSATLKPTVGETMVKPAGVAQPTPPTPTFKPGEEPKVVFGKTELDLGTVSEGDKVKFTFPFQNEGKSPLQILEVRKTCGCTRAESSKTEVKPGESAAIEGELDTLNRSGKQSKTIHVRTNDPINQEVMLRFDVTIHQEVGINPQSVFFRGLDLGETGKQEVKVTNFTDQPMRVTGFTATPEDKVKARIVSPLPEGKTNESAPVTGEKEPVVIEVTVAPSQEIGSFNGMLTIQTDNPKKPSIQVTVHGRVSGDLEVFPQGIYFGLLKDTQPTTRTATLSSRSGLPFKITKIDKAGLPVEIQYEPLEGKEGYRMKVGLTGPIPQGSINGKVRLETTHPKQAVVEIPVTAFVKK